MRNKRRKGVVRALVSVLLAGAMVTAVGYELLPGGKGDKSAEALAEELVMSRYALDTGKTDVKNEDPGLENPYIVGIDKARFEQEVLYPAPKGAYEIVVDAPAYEFQDSTAALQRAINAARRYQKENAGAEVVVKFPAGNFYFYQGGYDVTADEGYAQGEDVFDGGMNGTFAINLQNMRNITFAGSTDGKGNPTTECLLLGEVGFHFMLINRCENVHIYNMQIDYADPPYYFGEVVEHVSSRTLRIHTWADYPVEDTNIEVYLEYDKDTNIMRDAANNTYNSSSGANILKVEYVNGDKHTVDITFAMKMGTTPIGTKVALSNMKAAGTVFKLTRSKNVYFETVYLYCGGGSAILGYSNENVHFNRLMAILKPGTDRLLGIAGDVIHLEDTKGDFTLTNSRIENTQDDGINICGHYMYPYNVNMDKNSAILAYRGAVDATYECNPGDVLAMMNTVTMNVVGYYCVESVNYENGKYVVTFQKGGTAILPSGETVTLEENAAKIGNAENSIFSNITRSPKVLVENTVIRNKRNRGLLIQSRNVTVRNCEFVSVVNTALMLIGEMESFCEATLPRDVLVENCKFINCDDGDIEIAAYNSKKASGDAGAITGVTIRNNLFAYQQNRFSLYLSGVSGLELEHNWFYKPQTGTKITYDTSAICLRNCSEVSFDKNRLDKFLPSRDGIFVWQNVDVASFDWGDNYGFEKKDVFGETEAAPIAKLDASINIDGKIADWINVAATDVAINNVTNVHIQKVNFADVPTKDFSATVKTFVKLSGGNTFAADDGIYFYFNVTDDRVQFERSAWWSGDCFELFLSTNTTSFDEIGVLKDDEGTETLQLVLKGDVDGNSQPCLYPGRTTTSICDQLVLSTAVANAEYISGPIKTAFEMTKNGYRGEVFIPFTLFPVCGAQLRDGGEIAMVFSFVDGEEPDENEGLGKTMTFANIPHPTCTANKVPATMAKFKLAE